mgnify:CR=1 FL=1
MYQEILLTYRVTLDADALLQAKEDGKTAKDIQRDLDVHGIKSTYVADCEVEEVGDVKL